MKLHNEDVKLGDRVYDVSYNRGYGQVFKIEENKFHVRYGTANVVYGSNGTQAGRSVVTLFWDIPVILAPKKDSSDWQERLALINAVLDLIDKSEKTNL